MELPSACPVFVKYELTFTEIKYSFGAVRTQSGFDFLHLTEGFYDLSTPIFSKPGNQRGAVSLIFKFVNFSIIIIYICLPIA